VPTLPDPGACERVVVVFSDIEMGQGGPTDDFPHSEFLAELVLRYAEDPYRDVPVDMVFNGDTFDLLKTPYLGQYPHHITAEVATGKMGSIAMAHPAFFRAVGKLLASGRDRQVHFVVGNHDAELLFPEVQSLVRSLCGGSRKVSFPGFELLIGPVHIEHGSQQDTLFWMDPERPFIDVDGERLLHLSWASVALLDAIIPLHAWLHTFDRLRPRARVMSLVPEARELLMAQVWKYWTKDFWRDFLALGDPLVKLEWKMMKEIVWRMTTTNTEVQLDPRWVDAVVSRLPSELFVTGHLHDTASSWHSGRRFLQLGCFRDEYWVSRDGERLYPVLKPWAEIHLADDRVVGLVTRETLGPDRPPDMLPASLNQAALQARQLLQQLGDRTLEEARRKRLELEEGS